MKLFVPISTFGFLRLFLRCTRSLDVSLVSLVPVTSSNNDGACPLDNVEPG